MTVRRGFLYFGAFLVAAGGVALLTEAGVLDARAVSDVLAWWPLAIVAIGVGLVLRHTRAAIPGGIIAAATPGLLLGATFVALPALPTPCVDVETVTGTPTTRDGTFAGAATVDLSIACGELAVSTAPGTAWRVDAADGTARRTDVTVAANRLSVDTDPDEERRFGWNTGPVGVDVVLPTGQTVDLDVDISAGRGVLDLDGARLARLSLDVNAADARVDLTGAVVPRLDVDVNAASARIVLPATGDMTGDLNANAGSLEICAPAQLGLRVSASNALGSTTLNGLNELGDTDLWVTPGYDTAQYHADLSVSASVGSVDINSEGACK
jgi:hypothetical protein